MSSKYGYKTPVECSLLVQQSNDVISTPSIDNILRKAVKLIIMNLNLRLITVSVKL